MSVADILMTDTDTNTVDIAIDDTLMDVTNTNTIDMSPVDALVNGNLTYDVRKQHGVTPPLPDQRVPYKSSIMQVV